MTSAKIGLLTLMIAASVSAQEQQPVRPQVVEPLKQILIKTIKANGLQRCPGSIFVGGQNPVGLHCAKQSLTSTLLYVFTDMPDDAFWGLPQQDLAGTPFTYNRFKNCYAAGKVMKCEPAAQLLYTPLPTSPVQYCGLVQTANAAEMPPASGKVDVSCAVTGPGVVSYEEVASAVSQAFATVSIQSKKDSLPQNAKVSFDSPAKPGM